MNTAKLNIPKLIHACERHYLWEHAVFLYTHYDEERALRPLWVAPACSLGGAACARIRRRARTQTRTRKRTWTRTRTPCASAYSEPKSKSSFDGRRGTHRTQTLERVASDSLRKCDKYAKKQSYPHVWLLVPEHLLTFALSLSTQGPLH